MARTALPEGGFEAVSYDPVASVQGVKVEPVDGLTKDPVLTTRRLRLGRLRPEDAEAFYAYRSLPEVSRHLSFVPESLADVESYIQQSLSVAYNTPGTWFQVAVRLEETLIGDLGIHFLAEDPRQVEVGYTFAPHAQRRGYATEALTAILDDVFGRLGKHRARASVDPNNVGSLALLSKLGWRQEGHLRQALWFKGRWVDDVIFAILRSEWCLSRDPSGDLGAEAQASPKKS